MVPEAFLETSAIVAPSLRVAIRIGLSEKVAGCHRPVALDGSFDRALNLRDKFPAMRSLSPADFIYAERRCDPAEWQTKVSRMR
jgi:hypothetical protein